MYQKSYHSRSSRGTSGGGNRGGFGGRRPFGGGSSSRPRFNRGGFGGKRGGFKKSQIDIVRFISQSQMIEQNAPAEKKYVPQNQFLDFAVDEKLKKNIVYRGYKEPTPIQDQAIPHILAGRDLVGVANTGTGKTAAFLIPLLDKVVKNRSEKVLIITPTRELALQIEDEFRGFAFGTGLWSVACFGGANIGKQIWGLKRSHNFVIGTPGRLKDLIKRKVLNLSDFKNIVLDEVDRMLDIGFYDEIKEMLSLLPAERQSLFFSATVSGRIGDVIQAFLKDPVKVSVKTGETVGNIKQNVVKVNGHSEKMDTLHNMLNKEDFRKVLIFGRTKMGVEKLSQELFAKGFRVESIHGDKNQYKRQQALNSFKMDRINILVATDVAARGLDISDVSHVINFDLPDSYDDYIHRIGRTGRANKKGEAVTFVE